MKQTKASANSGLDQTAEEELASPLKFSNGKSAIYGAMLAYDCPTTKALPCRCFAAAEEGAKDWLVHFDYELKKICRRWHSAARGGDLHGDLQGPSRCQRRGPLPRVHVRRLSLADKPVSCVHMQSSRFGRGVPIYPRPIYILDESEGADLARTLGRRHRLHDQRPRHCHRRRNHRRSLHERASIWSAPPKSWPWRSLIRLHRVPDDFIRNPGRQQGKVLLAATRRNVSLRRVELLRREGEKRRILDPRLDVRIVSSLGLRVSG